MSSRPADHVHSFHALPTNFQIFPTVEQPSVVQTWEQSHCELNENLTIHIYLPLLMPSYVYSYDNTTMTCVAISVLQAVVIVAQIAHTLGYVI